MAAPVRHRQTKGAANRYAQPTATAPHLDSTMSRHRRLDPGNNLDGSTAAVKRRFGEMSLVGTEEMIN